MPGAEQATPHFVGLDSLPALEAKGPGIEAGTDHHDL
jgi:hypothetical protein